MKEKLMQSDFINTPSSVRIPSVLSANLFYVQGVFRGGCPSKKQHIRGNDGPRLLSIMKRRK